jgi:type I restriction enzyme S subunit
VTEVKEKNTGGREDNLLSLSYGNIVRRDIATADGLLPESFDSYNVINPGDTVLRLTDLQNDQRSLRVGLVEEVGIITSAYVTVRPSKVMHPKFLNYFLKHMDFRKDFYALGAGVRQSLKFDELRSVKVPVPALADQKVIADYLDHETARIDALIEKKLRIMTLIGHRTEILLANHLDELIKRYGEVPLKSVAKLSVSNVDKKSYDGQMAVKLCNYTDVYYMRKISNDIDFMEATADLAQIQKLALKKGDVLITKDSESADDIAVPALVIEDLPGVVLGYHLALLRPFAILGDFLYWVALSRRCRDAFSLAASGVTRFGLRQDAIARVHVPKAPLDEQMALTELFEKHITSGDSVVESIQRQVALLKERRQALITSAVIGELEIPEVAA